jgi:uncharacterized protein YndB with AHSA1/START domain
MKNEPVVIERSYNAPAKMIWNALTDSKQIQQWYFPITEFKPVVGFEFQFEGGSETVTYLHLCKITEVVEGKKIAYSWKYDGYQGNSIVIWELFEEGQKTRVKITHEGLDTFPQDKPDFSRSSFTGGWTYFADKALKNFVERNEK